MIEAATSSQVSKPGPIGKCRSREGPDPCLGLDREGWHASHYVQPSQSVFAKRSVSTPPMTTALTLTRPLAPSKEGSQTLVLSSRVTLTESSVEGFARASRSRVSRAGALWGP